MGSLLPACEEAGIFFSRLSEGDVYDLKLVSTKRTTQQNNALHKYLRLVAAALRDAGIDARKFFKPSVEIPVTMEMLKEDAWHPIQLAVVGKESTADLERSEINKVYEVFDRHLAQRHGVHVPFPSREWDDV